MRAPLTRAQLAHYRDRGWLVVDGLFPRATAERIAHLAWEISNAELLADPNPQTAYRADHSTDGQVLPRKIDHPLPKHPEFEPFVFAPALAAALRQLLGTDPLLCTDQIFMKPPRFGSAKPYHQDNFYFRCDPAESVITAWIALDDVDEENGCLRYIDGSHREGILPHAAVPGEPHNLAVADALIDRRREALALVRAGGVVFHHGATLHTSHRNESARWRRGYATHWVTAATTCAGDLLNKAYFRQGYPRQPATVPQVSRA